MKTGSIALAALAALDPSVSFAGQPKQIDPPAHFANQTVAGYQLSAIVAYPDVPAVECVLTAPANLTANVYIDVFYYDDDAQTALPYAHSSNFPHLVRPGTSDVCSANNGQQPLGEHKGLKRIKIQITAREPDIMEAVSASPVAAR